MKFRDVFKLIKKQDSKLNIIQIGYTTYYIIELLENKKFIQNKLLTKLMLLNIEFYWFSNYHQFETYFTYFEDNSKNIFIFIN